jgi:hypothetical protein
MSTPKPAEVDLLRSFVVLPAETGCNAPMLDTNEPTVVNLAGHLNILENYSGSTSSADHKTAATPGNPSGSPGTYDELKKIQEMRAMYLKKGRQLKATARDTPVEFLASLTDLDLDILKQVRYKLPPYIYMQGYIFSRYPPNPTVFLPLSGFLQPIYSASNSVLIFVIRI